MRLYLNSLKNGVLGQDASDVNYTHFDGNLGYNVTELKDIAETLPFFADRRLIVVENSGLFGSDSSFTDFVSNIPESTVIVLAEGKVDKRTSLYKEIKKQGYACEFTPLQPQQMLEFAAGFLGKAGKRISKADCEYLINEVGGDMFNITTELDKVIDYVGERDIVTRDDINAICSMQIENKIFEITDALLRGESDLATRLYMDLIALREQPIGILRVLQKQYFRMFLIKDEIEKGSSDSAVAEAVHIQDWLARKIRSQLKNYRKKQLLRAVELCAETEESIKNGDMNDSIGVEILLANLAAL